MLNNELKNNPFTTPENYFEALPSKIQDRCIASRKSSKFGLVPRFALAGGVAALAFTLFFSNINEPSELKNSNIQTADLEVQQQKNELLRSDIKMASDRIDYDGIDEYLALRNVNVDDILLARY